MTDREINVAVAEACGRGNPTAIRPLLIPALLSHVADMMRSR